MREQLTTIEDMNGNNLGTINSAGWIFDGLRPGAAMVAALGLAKDKPCVLRFYRKGARLNANRIEAQAEGLFLGALLLGLDLRAVRVENKSTSLLVSRPL